MIGRDLFLRYHDPSGKRPDVIRQLRAWDPALLTETEQAENEKLKAPDFRVVTVATRAEYEDTRRERVLA